MAKAANDPIVSAARTVGLVCSRLTIAVAVAVLVGWAIDNPFLKSIVPGLIAMNPLTAVCFILCGAALLIWREGAAGPRFWLPAAFAMVVGACGLARLGGYFFDWNLPIDRLIFPSRLDTGPGLPNRMAPNTAFNFCLTGLAIGRLVFGRARQAQILVLGSGLAAFIAVLGYTLSVTSLRQVAAFIPMALHTAVLFLLVAAAALCTSPSVGPMAAVTSRHPGGRVFRRMLPPLVLGPPALGWLRLQGELAGLYGPAFGVAMFVAAMVVMGLGLTWVTARALDRGDALRRRVEEETLRLAQYDKLTGLPNRMLFEDRLGQALARAPSTLRHASAATSSP